MQFQVTQYLDHTMQLKTLHELCGAEDHATGAMNICAMNISLCLLSYSAVITANNLLHKCISRSEPNALTLMRQYSRIGQHIFGQQDTPRVQHSVYNVSESWRSDLG